MHYDLPPDLVARLNFATAAEKEAERPRTMLPSRVAERILADRHKEYAHAVRARLTTGVDVAMQESAWVPKPGNVGRYRQLTVLPMQERVVLRALVADLGSDVPIPDRTVEGFAAFQSRPVEAEHAYVAVADVAAFYFFIDHQLLETRIVEASARADTAESIRVLLTALSLRSYGLPQNFVPSDSLSELYISWVERRMLRSGIATYRHNDDFRLGTDTWGEALQALETLGEELASIGLDLNAEKSWILRREKYEANLGLSDQYLQDALPDDFPAIDSYTGEPIDPEPGFEMPSDEEMDAVGRMMFESAATRRLSEERLNGFELRAIRELLGTALLLLRPNRSHAALELGPAIVAVDPAFTQSYVAYLAAIAGDGETVETSDRIMDVLGRFDGYAPAWVQAWLVKPLLAPGAGLSAAAADWLRGFLYGSGPAVLRVRAAVALAAHGKIEPPELSALFDSMPPAARPDVVAALAFAEPAAGDRHVTAVVESDHLHRWIFEYASEHRDDCSWA